MRVIVIVFLRIVLLSVFCSQSLSMLSASFAFRSYSRREVRMMPEGPEVRTLVDSLDARLRDKFLIGAEITSGRYIKKEPIGWNLLHAAIKSQKRGLCVDKVACKGKFIYMLFKNEVEVTILSTLGMTGVWTLDPSRTHRRLSLTFVDTEPSIVNDHPHASSLHTTYTPMKLYFCDTRSFGTFKVAPLTFLQAKLATLGVDWLAAGCASAGKDQMLSEFILLGQEAGKKKRPLCKFLMDQKKTAGIGNYILSEALYIAGALACADG